MLAPITVPVSWAVNAARGEIFVSDVRQTQ
jgi:hypothetical protein